MGSCCVREKEQNSNQQNVPHSVQVIRMQRRELLINHQQSKSIHLLNQNGNNSAFNNNEQTDLDTNPSTIFSPNTTTKMKLPTPTGTTVNSAHHIADKFDGETVEENVEFEMTTDPISSVQRQEVEKQSSYTVPLIGLQTLSSKNNINSDSNIDQEEVEQNLQDEKDITEIEEEDHEDSFSRQLSQRLRTDLIQNNQYMSGHKQSMDSDFPSQANDNSLSISGFSLRQPGAKTAGNNKTIQFERRSPNASRPNSSCNLNYSSIKSETASKSKSRNCSPSKEDLITQKQEVFNFQKSEDLSKLQQEAWCIKEEQLKTELKRQETYRMEEEVKKMDRKKKMKQFTQAMLGGTPLYRSSIMSVSNTPVNFQSTHGIGSICSTGGSPNSSDHKIKPLRTNSTHYTQHSQSLRSSYVSGSAMPGSINIPTSIFENFKARNKQLNGDDEHTSENEIDTNQQEE